MEYKGSCHCGQVKLVVEGELTEVLSCNCSICQKKGSLLWFLPTNQVKVTLDTPDNLANYTFNKHVINHHFCKIVVFIHMPKVQIIKVIQSLRLMYDVQMVLTQIR